MVNLTLKAIPLKTGSLTLQYSSAAKLYSVPPLRGGFLVSTIPLFHRTRQKLRSRLNISICNKLYDFRGVIFMRWKGFTLTLLGKAVE